MNDENEFKQIDFSRLTVECYYAYGAEVQLSSRTIWILSSDLMVSDCFTYCETCFVLVPTCEGVATKSRAVVRRHDDGIFPNDIIQLTVSTGFYFILLLRKLASRPFHPRQPLHRETRRLAVMRLVCATIVLSIACTYLF